MPKSKNINRYPEPELIYIMQQICATRSHLKNKVENVGQVAGHGTRGHAHQHLQEKTTTKPILRNFKSPVLWIGNDFLLIRFWM